MAEARRLIPAASHETRDIGEGFIWGAIATLLALLVLCAVLVLALYPHSTLDRILRPPLPEYPAPRLQPDPAEDFRRFQAAEMRQLESSGWVDRSRHIVHIPIERSMQLIAAEGIPGWPSSSADEQVPSEAPRPEAKTR
jgi:hypothetical protein